MLDLADSGHFDRKMHGKVKFFGFGLNTWTKRSLKFQIWLNADE